MPINIYKEKNFESIAHLCSEDWELPSQMFELEKWLIEEEKNLPKDRYVADIGFKVRPDSGGGGGVLSSKMINILQQLRMEIYFSEY